MKTKFAWALMGALILLSLFALGAAAGSPKNPTGSARSAANIPATFAGVTISNVSLNGGGDTAVVSPGSAYAASMDYFIVDSGCPGCIDEIQVGYSTSNPLTCIYQGIPGPIGVAGSATINVTAPVTSGTYYLGFDRAQDFSCPTFWWNGPPDQGRYFATVIVAVTSVKSGNWSDPTVWSTGVVPGPQDDVIIQGGHTVTLDVAGSTRGLTIQAVGALVVSGSQSLSVGGDLVVDGTFSPGQGVMVFDGSTTQHMVLDVPTTFYDITVLAGSTVIDAPLARPGTGASGPSQATSSRAVPADTSELTVQHTIGLFGSFTSGSTYNNINIASTGTLTASAGGTITVHGDMTNTGTLVANGSNFVFSNPGATQSLYLGAPTEFYDLTVVTGTTVVESQAAGPQAPAVKAGAAPSIPADTSELTVQHTIGLFGSFTSGSTYNNVYIGSAGTLTSKPGGTITVHGDMTNAGSFVANGGNVIFAGTGITQNLYLQAPTEFYDLTVVTGTTVVDHAQFGPQAAQTKRAPGAPADTSQLSVDHTIGLFGSFTSGSTYNNVYIGSEGTLNIPSSETVNVGGDLTNAGNVVPNGSTVIFDSGAVQNMTLLAPTQFNNLVVSPGTTLNTLGASTNVTVTGVITNQGTVSSVQPVTGTGPLTFGLAGLLYGANLTLDVTSQGGLTALRVDRYDTDHPYAGPNEQTGHYWTVTPVTGTAALFSMNVTLPHDLPQSRALACRYTGSGTNWDCGRLSANSVTSNTVTIDSNFQGPADWAAGFVVDSVGVSPGTQQYSDPVTYTTTLSPPSLRVGGQFVTRFWFQVGTQVVSTGTLAFDPGAGVLRGTAAAPLLEPVPFGTQPTGQMAPGQHTVTALYLAGSTLFPAAVPTTPLTITPEDARGTYTGALFASTGCNTCNTAIVTLAATVRDISAVNGDPAYDPYAGDIRNATLTFVDRDHSNAVLCSAPVGLVNPNDTRTGTATCNFTANLGGDTSAQYTVGVVVGGYYARNISSEDSVVTVSLPLTSNFITGGGYLVLQSSGGQKAGDPGSLNNFGFNVHYNAGGRNLQGHVNTLVRRTETDRTVHVYQIKSNSITSLSVNPSTHQAVFNGKASIQDITDPLHPVSVDGNATLQLTMTDNGDPGTRDTIGITVWNKAGGLWFSSRWNGVQTVEQNVGAGSLIVH